MVITQQAAQSLAALNMPLAAGVCAPREQQDITLPLMIPFGMEMFDIFAQRSPQRALAKEDHLAQALLLHRPDPALRIGVKVRAARTTRVALRPQETPNGRANVGSRRPDHPTRRLAADTPERETKDGGAGKDAVAAR